MMICNAEASNETFRDTEKLVYNLTHRYKCCDQCDFDDRLGTAFEAYVRAYHGYDSRKGAEFSTWVYWQVRSALQDRRKSCVRYRTRFQLTGKVYPNQLERPNFWTRVFESLGKETLDVLKALLDAPDETQQLWVNSSDSVGMARSYLSGMGWSMKALTSAFSEISELLKEA